MKRLIAILLAGILMLSAFPALAEEETEPAEDNGNPYPNRNYEELSVGNPTPMDGKFFTGMWGNSTTDIDVRTLVNSYYLTVWGYETGCFRPNPVTVSGYGITEDDSGCRIYRMEIAPGCKVYDDGDGIYIGNEDPEVKEKIFTADLLRATVMDPENGYLSHPTVGSGPYVLTSWDGEVCTFEINPYFKGNQEGYKPTIQKLRFTLAENDTMIEKLEADEFQLLNKVVRKDVIEQGLGLVSGGKGFTLSNYPRIGLSFIVFTPDRPALQEMNVRKAIAYCMDKDKLKDDYTAIYGIPMDGLIGIGQWMYGMVMGTEEYPVRLPDDPTPEEQADYDAKIEAWKALSLDGLTKYPLNVREAERLLEINGWTLNEHGALFRSRTDEVRCKEINGELVKLDLTCAYPVTNTMAEAMEEYFIPYLKQAGIRVTLVPMTMKELLRSYNDKDVEDIDMFYLGDDFNIEFDPQLFFLAGDPEEPKEDTLAWVHSQMAEYARLMCETEPDDAFGFVQKWITFQEQLSDMLPLIPVYSNVYFDFYTSDLMNYDIVYYITWGDAIVPASYYNVFQSMIDMGIDPTAVVGEDEGGGETDPPDNGTEDQDE